MVLGVRPYSLDSTRSRRRSTTSILYLATKSVAFYCAGWRSPTACRTRANPCSPRPVAFLLLLACANVANLLLARAAERQKEIAVFSALGAGGGRIARRLLVESILLALAGGALGIVLGRFLIRYMRGFLEVLPIGMAGWAEGTEWMRLDERMLLFTFGLSLLTGLLFGLAPALWALRIDLVSALRGGALDAGGRRFGARRILVVAQVMLSTILVLGAALLTSSLDDLSSRSLGFEPDDKILAAFATARDSSLEGLPRREQERRLYELGRSRLAALPEVASAALVSEPPGIGARTTRMVLPGREEESQIAQAVIGGNFFTVLNVSVRGRAFEPADDAGAQGVAIVNEAFVERYFPNEDGVGEGGIGREMLLPDLRGVDVPDARFLIIGVAEDVIHGSRRNPPQPVAYLSFRQVQRSSRMIMIAQARGERGAGAARGRAHGGNDPPGSGIHRSGHVGGSNDFRSLGRAPQRHGSDPIRFFRARVGLPRDL